MSNLLRAVSQWRQEAAQEDMKYLYERDDFADLMDGRKFIVSGRKGAGKTATLIYVNRRCEEGRLPHRHLNARDLDFHSLNQAVSASRAQAEGFWREIILTTAISLLNDAYLRDNNLRPVSIDTRAVSEIASYLKTTPIQAKYKDLSLFKSSDMNWQDRAFASKRFLQELGPKLPQQVDVIVTFDRLDASFRHDATPDEMSAYLRLIDALVGAAQGIHEDNPFGRQIRVLPIVLLRSDILARVASNDKTKWRDTTIDLVWTPREIRSLLAHRISIDSGLDKTDFMANWSAILSPELKRDRIKDRYDSGTRQDPARKDPFDWIEFRTTWCPRDYIFYLRECADIATKRHEDEIVYDRLVSTEFNYSTYVRDQLLDEGLPHLPDLKERLDQMSRLAKSHPSKRKFSLDDFASTFELSEDGVRVMLDTLYHLNAIGNLAENFTGHPHNRYKFHYKDKLYGAMDKKGALVIHPGLYRSLT